MAAAVRETFITLDTENTAYIDGTTTKVIEVVQAKIVHELTPEALQRELPHLSLAQIYAALAYYHAHQSELDAQIAAQIAYADDLRRANPNPWTREQLLSRRNDTK